MSNHRFTKSWGFTGDQIFLFGVIENPTQPTTTPESPTAIVVIQGPNEQTSIRRRGAGPWIGFIDVPGYYHVLSDKPLDHVPQSVLIEQQLGVRYLRLRITEPQVGLSGPQRAELTDAFLRHKFEQRVYLESDTGITFLTPNLFRASTFLPANSPSGTYDVSIFLFENGKLVRSTETAFEVVHIGMAAFFHSLAAKQPYFSGLLLFSVIFGSVLGIARLSTGESLNLLRGI